MVEAAMATSAAPTYFRPVRIKGASGAPELVLVDGGVFANNPTMCGFVDHSTAQGVAEGTLIVSLGTGEPVRRASPVYPSAKRWGLIGWAKRILGIVFDGVSEATNYEIESVLGKTDFFRFQVELAPAQEHMDDAHTPNVQALEGLARKLIADRTVEIDELCVTLLQRAGKPLPARYGGASREPSA
jgi:patatin-like phospholipase/acyl hydrolase